MAAQAQKALPPGALGDGVQPPPFWPQALGKGIEKTAKGRFVRGGELGKGRIIGVLQLINTIINSALYVLKHFSSHFPPGFLTTIPTYTNEKLSFRREESPTTRNLSAP